MFIVGNYIAPLDNIEYYYVRVNGHAGQTIWVATVSEEDALAYKLTHGDRWSVVSSADTMRGAVKEWLHNIIDDEDIDFHVREILVDSERY